MSCVTLVRTKKSNKMKERTRLISLLICFVIIYSCQKDDDINNPTNESIHSEKYPLEVDEKTVPFISESRLTSGYENPDEPNLVSYQDFDDPTLLQNVVDKLSSNQISNPQLIAEGIINDSIVRKAAGTPLMLEKIAITQNDFTNVAREISELALMKIREGNVLFYFEEDNDTYNISLATALAETLVGAGENGEDVIVFRDIFKKTSGINFMPTLLNELLESDIGGAESIYGQHIQLILGDLFKLHTSPYFPDALFDETLLGVANNNLIMAIYHNGALSTNEIETVLNNRFFNHPDSKTPSAPYETINTYEENINGTYQQGGYTMGSEFMPSFTRSIFEQLTGKAPQENKYSSDSKNLAFESVHQFFDNDFYREKLEEKIK